MTNAGTLLWGVSYLLSLGKRETCLARPAFPKGRERLGGALRLPAQENQIGAVQQILGSAVNNSLNIIESGHGRRRCNATLFTQRIHPGGGFNQFGVVELTGSTPRLWARS